MSRSRGGQRRQPGRCGAPPRPGGAANASISRLVTDGREQRVAGRRHPDRGDQVGARRVLEQEPARPGAQRLVHVVVEVERGQDDHLRARPAPAAVIRRVASSPSITGIRMSISTTSGRCAGRGGHRLGAVRRLAHHGEARRPRGSRRSRRGPVPGRRRPAPAAERAGSQVHGSTGVLPHRKPCRNGEPAAVGRDRPSARRRRRPPVPRYPPGRTAGPTSAAAGPSARAAAVPAPCAVRPAPPGPTRCTVSEPAGAGDPHGRREPGACRSVFVSASCTIRYAVRSMPAGSAPGSPSTVRVTGSPAARTASSTSSRRDSEADGVAGTFGISLRRMDRAAPRAAGATPPSPAGRSTRSGPRTWPRPPGAPAAARRSPPPAPPSG